MIVPRVKEAHLAGRWYPAEPDVLAATVRGLLAAAPPPRPNVVAIVVPHAAYEYSGATAARGLAAARGLDRRRAVLLAPSHYASFRGAAVLAIDGYRTPLGLVTIDAEGVAELARAALVRVNPAVFMREHALEIQLPLLQTLLPGCPVVPLLIGDLEAGDAAALAALLRSLLRPEDLLIVSSDMTHYGRRFDYLPFPSTDAPTVAAAIRRLDEGALDRVVAADAEGFARYVAQTGATICGRNPIEVLLRALPPGVRGERIAYATSLEVNGDHGHVVSYAAIAFAAAAA